MFIYRWLMDIYFYLHDLEYQHQLHAVLASLLLHLYSNAMPSGEQFHNPKYNELDHIQYDD